MPMPLTLRSTRCEGANRAVRIRHNDRWMNGERRNKANSFGQLGMRECTFILGGEVRIESRPGHVATVEIAMFLPSGQSVLDNA